MKTSFLACLSLLVSTAAYADNAAVDNVLKSQPDLSAFTQAAEATGALRDLNPSESYTVFAPTNAAFAQFYPDPAGCLKSESCAAGMASILRNHIVPGKIAMSDAVQHQGGLFAINQRFITLGEPRRREYTVDGQDIISATGFGSGILYKTSGVVAQPRERAMLYGEISAAAGGEEHTTTEKTVHTLPDPACPNGCPDSSTETTTTIRTVVDQ